MSLKFTYYELGSISDVKGGKRLPKGHELTSKKNNHPYIKVKNISSSKLLELNENFHYIDEDTFNKISNYTVNEGDLIISIVGTIGLTNIIDSSLNLANLTENCAKITNLKKEFNIDYIYYFLNSKIGLNLINESTVGAVQKKLPIKNIKSIKIPFPEINTQNKICNFLDKKIPEIKNNISKNKELIYLLEEKKASLIYKATTKGLNSNVIMKDSGIKWIGKIPEHWNVFPLKYLANTIPGGTPSTNKREYWENGNIPWLPSGMVQNCVINEEDVSKYITFKGLLNSATKFIGPNSVLIALTGATCANIGFLTFKATANQSVISIEPYEFIPKFIYYYLLAQREQILINKTGGAQGGINEENVKNISIVSLSIQEQNEIVHFLDNEISKIDDTINRILENLQLLEEYKASLIYHVVTGKVDVRDEV